MRSFLIVLGLLAATTASAADLRQPVPKVFALVDVRVVVEPGTVLDAATVVIRDGVIVDVGTDVEPPADARRIEFELGEDQPPVTVYPGLIEPYLVLESTPAGADEETPAGHHPLIQPDVTVGPEHWPADRVEALRAAGFTTALIAPGSGLLRGQSLIANLGDGGLAANLLRERFAQHAYLHDRAPGDVYPQSLMGAVALFRQTLLDAAWQQGARAAWQSNPAQARPEWLPGLDALAPVLSGQQPLVFEARDTVDSLRILELLDPAIDLTLVGHGAEYQRLNAFGRKPRIVLPLKFPDAPDVKDESDRDVSLEELRHWKQAPANPARLAEAGFELLFTAHRQSAPQDVLAAAARAIEQGLSPERALAALTTVPAAWLGLEDRAGRIATGYMANLVIVDGELLTEKPALREVWIDGVRFELAKLEPPEVEPAGTWALTLAFGGMGDIEGELKLEGSATALSGTITVMGNEAPLAEARVSGKTLTLKIDAARWGQGGTTTIRLDIDGDQGRGTGSGPFGEFSVRGRRSAGPGDEEVDA